MRRAIVTLLVITTWCSLICALVAQEPLPASSGSGEAFVEPAPHKGISITFDNDDPFHPHSPMESHYVYDPQAILVLDHTGKPLDLSAIHHKRVQFKAMPNQTGITNILDSRMQITKVVLLPPETQRGSAAQELAQRPTGPPPLSGSGKVTMVLPVPHQVMIQTVGPSSNGGLYGYDPKNVVVLDEAGKPLDITAVGGKPVDFTAAPNAHFVNNGNDCPVIVTKLVINPAAAAAVAAAPQSQGWDFMNAMGEQMRAYEAQQAKKKAEQEAAARAKAEREENLRQQMARKQQESLLAQEKEKQRKVIEANQRAQQAKAKREQFAATIVRTKAKIIEEKEVAPAGATNYVVSPRGLHVAAVTLKGSRTQVLMDGVPGPTFDELILTGGRTFKRPEQMFGYRDPDKEHDAPVVFSEDGSRFAYIGRQGKQFVVMLGGKEFARGTYTAKAVKGLSFSPGGHRLRYLETSAHPTGPGVKGAEEEGGMRLVVEGDDNPFLQPVHLHDVPITFSPDGQHYAYYAGFPAQASNGWTGETHLIVDGEIESRQYTVPNYKIKSYASGTLAPLFTGDSQHLITVRQRQLPDPHSPGHTMSGSETLFVDQKPLLEAPFIERQVRFGAQTKYELRRFYARMEQVSAAPAGTNLLTVFAMPNENPEKSSKTESYRLFFNDRKIVDAAKIESIAWSPDGKRYSAVCTTKQNSQFMVVDGKKEPEYAKVSTVYQGSRWASRAFTADSSKAVYLAWSGGKEFLVVEDAESDGYKAIEDLTFSEKGDHIAFVATTETGQKMGKTRNATAPGSQQLVVDGQALEPRQDVHDFMFSPDGTHYAFLSGGASSDKRGAKVVVDGVEQPFEFGGDFVHYTTGYEPDRKFLFSPDGKHVLYLASFGRIDSSGYSVDHSATKAVCLDGKLIPCEGEKSEISAFFTPDSKHVVWIDSGGASARLQNNAVDAHEMGSYSIYVDGQLDGRFDVLFARTKEASEIGADGTLTFVAQVGNAVKKLRVTPATDTNLARFAALAEERELAAEEESASTAQASR
jgi:dipeptidyl aminopeptidase/acylaminoacyl peptidase